MDQITKKPGGKKPEIKFIDNNKTNMIFYREIIHNVTKFILSDVIAIVEKV